MPRSLPHQDPRHAKRLALCFALLAYVSAWAMLRLQQRGMLAAQPNWPLIGDLLLTVPLVYWWLNRRAGRAAWIGAAGLCALGIWVGAWLMPTDPFLQDAARLRWVAAALTLAFECALIVSLLRVLPQLRRSDNPETLLLDRIVARLGTQPFVRFVQWEARMWLHLLAPARWRWQFAGAHHYSYHRKDANASDQIGFIVLMLLSLPIDHLLLMMWSPLAAWILTALTAYASCGAIAHYRAIHRRPISIETRRICLRNGLVGDVTIDLAGIAAVMSHRGEVARRTAGVLRLGTGNRPNVCLLLHETQALPGPLGTTVLANTVYFSVDAPGALIAELQSRIATPVLPSVTGS